jgi:hypothetical protein
MHPYPPPPTHIHKKPKNQKQEQAKRHSSRWGSSKTSLVVGKDDIRQAFRDLMKEEGTGACCGCLCVSAYMYYVPTTLNASHQPIDSPTDPPPPPSHGRRRAPPAPSAARARRDGGPCSGDGG